MWKNWQNILLDQQVLTALVIDVFLDGRVETFVSLESDIIQINVDHRVVIKYFLCIVIVDEVILQVYHSEESVVFKKLEDVFDLIPIY